MMRLATRRGLLLAALAVCLLLPACSSNNTGKIEGKWKFASGNAALQAQAKQLDEAKAYLFFEFRPDHTATIGVESTDPDMQKLLVGGAEKATMTCKYKLLSGDGVEFYDMPKEMQDGVKGGGFFGSKDRARTKIKIVNDTMTMTDPDGTTLQCARIK